MIRPAAIAASLLGVVTAGAVVTLTHSTAHVAHTKADQQVCIVLAKDDQHQHTQDFCVDWGTLLKQQ